MCEVLRLYKDFINIRRQLLLFQSEVTEVKYVAVLQPYFRTSFEWNVAIVSAIKSGPGQIGKDSDLQVY